MSDGPHAAAGLPPDTLRCPHEHWQAEDKPTTRNPDPNCRGRCVFYRGHPHAPGHRDAARYRAAPEYQEGCCLCDTCHKWVKDWIQPRTHA